MQGLEIYNADGTLQFTTSSRLTRFLDSFNIGTGAGSRVVLGLNTGTPIAFASPNINNNTSFWGVPVPTFSFNESTQTVSWGSISNPQVSGYSVIIAVY